VDAATDTPDGRLHLGVLTYVPGIESPDTGSTSRFPLALISRKQHLKFLNANYGGFEKHLQSEGEPLLQIHEIDAAYRGIASGDRVTVFNDRGSLTLTSAISSDVQPGVTAIPFGWWNRHTPNQRGVNVLTNPTTPADDIGSAAFHDTLVEVQLITGSATT
jgi:anaerobic selenocysteine-containing dehydrogenase